MSVTRNKYWKIAIDGRPVRPLPTNIAYQGVVVDTGHHVITMTYRNDLAAGGVKISLTAALLLLGGTFVRPRRER
jgi:hypothetical protein